LLTQFPYQLLECKTLREIYLGSNKICALPRTYEQLTSLEILYLGGNQIKCIPEEFSQLKSLTSLNLSNNLISSLPNSLVKLKNMKNLALHGNNLTTLPIELVKLNIKELSLRNNPLVKRFARDFVYNVPSLLELSGRVAVKAKHTSHNQNFTTANLPKHLVDYLNSAQCCLNPKCKGVYFTSKVEHIKFVDFCGKFRVPLMQYLCSSTCNEKIAYRQYAEAACSSSSSDSDEQAEDKLLKKILIG
jgi:Leucine-rich repeat (LRR) protein